ncbi:MAG: hypothetical protein JJE22_01130 [Bacteroidia bacterium]|nr:hypothetical protein [Bacteroidia bacterium]
MSFAIQYNNDEEYQVKYNIALSNRNYMAPSVFQNNKGANLSKLSL